MVGKGKSSPKNIRSQTHAPENIDSKNLEQQLRETK